MEAFVMSAPRVTVRSARTWLCGITGDALACVVTLLCVAPAASWAQAQNYSVIYSFQCGPNDGESPYGDLIADSAGNLYGTTHNGGTFGDGAVFEVSASGTETVLHNFAGSPTDGALPAAGLVRDAAGNLYGTTREGGAYGDGTVFEVSADGAETILYSFTGSLKVEGYPLGNLLLDASGNVYGTTTIVNSGYYGTVFKLSPGDKLTDLYAFAGPPDDGAVPESGLIRDSASNLYGTTFSGGASGWGTVFQLSRAGVETILYSFAGGSDGENPAANLVRDAAGNLYGTTVGGGDLSRLCEQGDFSGCGTVFKVTPAGQETLLYTFTGEADGANPFSDLILDPKGNLYGTASIGGSSSCGFGCGVVFEVTATGKEKVLHTFTYTPDGSNPYGGLLHVGNYLYGTTYWGGTYQCGTVYKLTP